MKINERKRDYHQNFGKKACYSMVFSKDQLLVKEELVLISNIQKNIFFILFVWTLFSENQNKEIWHC